MTAQFLQTHFAVAVCAISGGLAGSGKRVDVFGVIVLGGFTPVRFCVNSKERPLY